MRTKSPQPKSVAVVVTPHGFGHAARASAVMAALVRRRPDLELHLLTTVPRWFFAQSLLAPFRLHRIVTDVGLVQQTPLEEDLGRTVSRLAALLDNGEAGVRRLTRRIERLGCRLVLADISPMGIAAARRLGVPAVLIENFTWDWVYRSYTELEPRLARYAARLAEMSATADLHIQATPACRRDGAAVLVPTIARRPRVEPELIRRRLRVPTGEPMVLLTMGGIRWAYEGLARIERDRRAWVVVPGGAESPRTQGRLVLLPFQSEFYHPDLVQAADVVVGKLGYSTVAEVVQGRTAMAYISRSRFPESSVLADFIGRRTPSIEISEDDLRDGRWLDVVDRLLEAPRSHGAPADGAEQAADVILDRFAGVLR